MNFSGTVPCYLTDICSSDLNLYRKYFSTNRDVRISPVRTSRVSYQEKSEYSPKSLHRSPLVSLRPTLASSISYNCFSKFNQNNMKYNLGEFLLLLTVLRNSPNIISFQMICFPTTQMPIIINRHRLTLNQNKQVNLITDEPFFPIYIAIREGKWSKIIIKIIHWVSVVSGFKCL